MNRNIILFYLYKIFSGMFFAVPVLVLFWQDNGLSLTQIMILQSLFAVATVILEVPSGYFSDYYGRRKTLIIASVSGTAAIGLYGLGSSFWHFLGAEMLFALNVSFVSGTASALVYETLLEEGREGEYKKIWGHAFFLGTMALALSNILGGVIGEFSLRYTIYASVPFFLAAVPLSILLREPERKRKDVKDGHLKELLAIGMKIVTHKRLGGIIFYSGVIFAFNQSVLWLYQPYFKLSGMDVLYFGAVFALFQVTAAFSSKYAHSLEAWLGEKRSLVFLTLITGSSYLLMGSFVFALSFLFCLLQQFVRGYKSTVITDYINRIAPSESRATVLSAESLVGRLVYALIVPVFGYFADTYSLARTLIIMGATTLAAGGFILAFLRKNRVI